MDKNTLYYGDNLDVLRRYVPDASVDLIYLDPPFNSNATYNVLFAEQDGSRSAAQIKAFGDTWRWDQASALAYDETVEAGGGVSRALQAFRTLLGDSNMLAYLAMMAPRLVELHRVLKPTGSLYLHCDPTASHYLKIVLDAIFDPQRFTNELVWKRSAAHSDRAQGSRHFGRLHDVILFYSRSEGYRWNQHYEPHSDRHLATHYTNIEVGTGRRYTLDNITGPGGAAKGNPSFEVFGVTRYWRFSRLRMQELVDAGLVIQTRAGAVPRQKRYLDEMSGRPLQDVWDDIPPVNSQAKERMGYPTQKPEALLERIISASSNVGDVVLDPFCGCGTAIAAAQNLGRRWIGIDVTHLAIGLIKSRLLSAFGPEIASSYTVVGEPTTVEDTAQLAQEDPFQFQAWALGLVGARTAESNKKGADKGIDGRLYFHDDPAGKTTKQIVFSVKGGHLKPEYVRELPGIVTRENAQIGVLISFEKPTQPMRTEAASAGFYESPWGKHPRVQLLTIEELLDGKMVDYPRGATNRTLRLAPRVKEKAVSLKLDLAGD